MLRILATAYDVDPYRGSEGGTGWNLLLQLSRFFDVEAVTRENNRGNIERYVAEHKFNGGRLRFHYFDLPASLRFWKRGRRGSSLYFYLWQAAMPGFVRRSGISFDIAHNLNFHADWAPSFLWRLRKPLVWGPIGHHPRIPPDFVRPYGSVTASRDALKWLLKRSFWKFDPFLRQTVRSAVLILCVNSTVRSALQIPKSKAAIFPAVGTLDFGSPEKSPEKSASRFFEVLSVGRFVSLKGFDLAIRAFSAFTESIPQRSAGIPRLTLVGEGPRKDYLKRLVADVCADSHIRILPWVGQDQLKDIYRQSAVFLYPSHEGAGMVVAEALSAGLPVVCLSNAGPGELVSDDTALRVQGSDYRVVVQKLAAALQSLHQDQSLRDRLSSGARKAFEERFAWDAKGLELKRLYDERGLS